jgi:hypothetical protein
MLPDSVNGQDQGTETTQAKQTSADKAGQQESSEKTEPPAQASENKAASSQESATPRAKAVMPIAVSDWHLADTHYYEKPQTIRKQLAGDSDFITLIEPDLSGNPKGVAIVLPDWQQHLAHPKAVGQLRKELPAKGWHIIALLPPEKPDNFPQTWGTKEEIKLANQMALTAYQSELMLRMKAVLQNAQNFPGPIMVIASGANAALLPQLFNEKKLPQPSIFVALSSYLPSADGNENAAQALASTRFPVLDLYLDKDNLWVLDNAPRRKIWAQKKLKISYRQQRLLSTDRQYPPGELSHKILSWLKSLGW